MNRNALLGLYASSGPVIENGLRLSFFGAGMVVLVIAGLLAIDAMLGNGPRKK